MNVDGERSVSERFEPRGNAETPGWRLTGDRSMKPAMCEGLAEAQGNT